MMHNNAPAAYEFSVKAKNMLYNMFFILRIQEISCYFVTSKR